MKFHPYEVYAEFISVQGLQVTDYPPEVDR